MVLQFLKRAEVSANDNLMSVFVGTICQNKGLHLYSNHESLSYGSYDWSVDSFFVR